MVRDVRAIGKAEGAVRADLADRIFGWSFNLTILIGALALATHRLLVTW
jgi:sigma54-dependent transcription regulator